VHPYSSRAFQRYQEHDMKSCDFRDVSLTKQNNLPDFIEIKGRHSLSSENNLIFWGDSQGLVYFAMDQNGSL
jgi:hypothetical protein